MLRFLFFVLLIVLIAQLGFWKTFTAVLGAVAMVVLLAAVGVAVIAIGVTLVAAALRRG